MKSSRLMKACPAWNNSASIVILCQGLKRWTALVLALRCFATTTVATPSREDITPTQGVIRVTTDQPGNCTYRVSEGSIFVANVDDTNPNLFKEANSDARLGSLIQAKSHIFVAGTRTAARALDGKYYSRALQVNTQHWVGVTCGSDKEVSTTFRTINPPLGNTAPDPMPFDPSAFGNVAVPSIDWSSKDTSYNDPLTGFQLRRATGPDDNGFLYYGSRFVGGLDNSGRWQNPANAASANADRLATCDTRASCTPRDALFLPLPALVPLYRTVGGWAPGMSITDMLARAWGYGAGASANDRTVSVCWSVDSGQTCATNSQDIVLPASPSYAGTAPALWQIASPISTLINVLVNNGFATVTTRVPHGLTVGRTVVINGVTNASVSGGIGGNGLNGAHTILSVPSATTLTFRTNAGNGTYTDPELTASAGFPHAQWRSWGTAPLRADIGVWGGKLNVSRSVLTPSNPGASSNLFNIDWKPGTKIFVNRSTPACANNYCTIVSLQGTRQATIAENPGSLSETSWQSANSGLRVVKKSGAGVVSVSFNFDYATSSSFNSGLSGAGDICSANLVTVRVDRDGNPISPSVTGYLCEMAATVSGQNAHNVYLFIPSTGETRLIAHMFQLDDYTNWIGWHPTDGRSWYCHKANTSFFLATYTGDFREFGPGYLQLSTEAPVPELLTYRDVFAGSGNDLVSQIRNCRANNTCDTAINEHVFGLPGGPPQTGAAINGKHMVLCGSAGGQDTPGFMVRVDMSQNPAKVVRVSYTWDKYPVGYGGIHGCMTLGAGPWNALGLNAQLGQTNGRLRAPTYSGSNR